MEIGDVDPKDRVDYLDYLQRAGLAQMNVTLVGKPMKLVPVCPRSESARPEPGIDTPETGSETETCDVTSDKSDVTSDGNDVTTERTETTATERPPSESFIPSEGAMTEHQVCVG